MSSECIRVKLSELVHIKHGFAFKGEHFVDEQSPHVLVTPGNFAIGGGFQDTKLKFYRGPVPKEYVLEPGDLVVTMTDLSRTADTLGYSAVVPNHANRVYLHNQRIGLVQVIQPAKVKTAWLHYLLRSPEYRSWVVGSATGSTVKHTSPTRIGDYEFDLPRIDEQQEVTATLDALEARIGILRQTNATLEAIAQALFKSWFVDFDPVRAKAEGREPEGVPPEVAALFPSEFEDSALGEIPKGWRVGTYREIAALTKGSVNPLNSPTETYEHYSLPAFDASQLPVFELGQAIKSNKTRIGGEIVLQSKLNPHIPRVWLPFEVGVNAVCSTEFLPWSAKAPASQEFLFCLLASSTFAAKVRTLVTGTSNSHQRVRPEQVADLQVVIAPAPVFTAFSEMAKPLFRRVGKNRLTCDTLAKMRDTLLPRLMSGKLQLNGDIEGIEEAQGAHHVS